MKHGHVWPTNRLGCETWQCLAYDSIYFLAFDVIAVFLQSHHIPAATIGGMIGRGVSYVEEIWATREELRECICFTGHEPSLWGRNCLRCLQVQAIKKCSTLKFAEVLVYLLPYCCCSAFFSARHGKERSIWTFKKYPIRFYFLIKPFFIVVVLLVWCLQELHYFHTGRDGSILFRFPLAWWFLLGRGWKKGPIRHGAVRPPNFKM